MKTFIFICLSAFASCSSKEDASKAALKKYETAIEQTRANIEAAETKLEYENKLGKINAHIISQSR